MTVERLPAYAPELNPIEQVWGHVKTRELANVCAPDLAALRPPLRAYVGSLSSPSRSCGMLDWRSDMSVRGRDCLTRPGLLAQGELVDALRRVLADTAEREKRP